MQYAVIRTGGKQYKVNVGDTLEVDKIISDKKEIVFNDVLLFVNEGKVSIGKPNVKDAKVTATLVENIKGEKIRVAKFKAKSRYRKVIGFRSQLSVIKINKIEAGSTKLEEKAEKTTKSAPTESKK
jgi:large subunit ribosomal protein L21